MGTKFFKRGFSLLEMLVYIAILVFMLGVIVEVVLSVTRAEKVMKSLRQIENSAIVSIESIARSTRAAASIDMVNSIFGVDPGRLSLQGVTDFGNPILTEYYIANGRLMLRENGEEKGYLTESAVEVTDLKFHLISASSTYGVRVEMTLSSGTSTHFRSDKFYSGATLR